MEHNYSASYGNVRLRPLKREDIESLRIWRNDTYKTRYLRPIGHITVPMQEQWFEKYLQNKQEICFAIEETETLHRLVGSLSLYDFTGHSAEVGKILIGDPEAHGRGIGRISMVAAMKIGFQFLGLKKIIASVHQENIPSHNNMMRIGFQIVGSHPSVVGGLEDELVIEADRLEQVNTCFSQICVMDNNADIT